MLQAVGTTENGGLGHSEVAVESPTGAAGSRGDLSSSPESGGTSTSTSTTTSTPTLRLLNLGPQYIRNRYLKREPGIERRNRRSAVELLEESKSLYVKSESVLDNKQLPRNAESLQVGQRRSTYGGGGSGGQSSETGSSTPQRYSGVWSSTDSGLTPATEPTSEPASQGGSLQQWAEPQPTVAANSDTAGGTIILQLGMALDQCHNITATNTDISSAISGPVSSQSAGSGDHRNNKDEVDSSTTTATLTCSRSHTPTADSNNRQHTNGNDREEVLNKNNELHHQNKITDNHCGPYPPPPPPPVRPPPVPPKHHDKQPPPVPPKKHLDRSSSINTGKHPPPVPPKPAEKPSIHPDKHPPPLPPKPSTRSPTLCILRQPNYNGMETDSPGVRPKCSVDSVPSSGSTPPPVPPKPKPTLMASEAWREVHTDTSSEVDQHSTSSLVKVEDKLVVVRRRPRKFHRSRSDLTKRFSNSSDLSELSARFSRNSADLEKFFNEMGLDRSVLEPMMMNACARSASDLHLFESASSLESPDVRSWCSDDDTEHPLKHQAVEERTPPGAQSSIVERNARIIKWLCSVKKAASHEEPLTET